VGAVATTELPTDQRQLLPPGLRPPVANYDGDGGVRFPLTRDGIKAAVEDAKPQVRECYEEWLKANPALSGQLKIGFRIAADGGPEAVVDQVRLVGDAGMGNLAFEGCVLSVMGGLRFDAPPEGTLNVSYPFTFSNDGGP
jgi:hypothetical protein